MPSYNVVAICRQRVPTTASYFFAPDTMRFFNSRIESDVIGDRFFITSEAPPQEGRVVKMEDRKYSVREITSDEIRTVGEFHSHPDRRSARRVIDDILLMEGLKEFKEQS